MWKAWIENGNIFISPDPNIALDNAIDVPENTMPNDLKIVDGELVFKTEEEKLQELKNRKLSELKRLTAQLLSRTDWVIIKLHSLRLEGADDDIIQAEESKYSNILENRRRIREWNDNMEQAILQASSIDELNQIELTLPL